MWATGTTATACARPRFGRSSAASRRSSTRPSSSVWRHRSYHRWSMPAPRAGPTPTRPLRLVMVGNFVETTQQYANRIQEHLGSDDTIVVTTVDALHAGEIVPPALRYLRDAGASPRRGRASRPERHSGRGPELHSGRGNTGAACDDRSDGPDRHRVDLSRIHGPDEARRAALCASCVRRRCAPDHGARSRSLPVPGRRGDLCQRRGSDRQETSAARSAGHGIPLCAGPACDPRHPAPGYRAPALVHRFARGR